MPHGSEDGAKRVFRILCATELAIGLICSPMLASSGKYAVKLADDPVFVV